MKLKGYFFGLFLFFFLNIALYSQQSEPIQLINADSLVGAEINSEPVRILIGNVNLIQGDVIIFCDKATQFLISNKAHLDGNVRVNQKTVYLNSNSGFYDGNAETAFCPSKIRLFDGKVNLIANSGHYYFKESKANFVGDVRLCDDSTDLFSDSLIYFSKSDKAIAIGNVCIELDNDLIFSDSLIHFRNLKYSIAKNNVRVESRINNLTIYSDYLENFDAQKRTFLKGNSLLIQIDSTELNYADTLIISCDSIETLRLYEEIYYAYDSVNIWRSGFASKNDFTQYFKSQEKIVTFKLTDTSAVPVFWFDINQIFADSLIFFLAKNKIKKAELFNDCFIISQDSLNPVRFNQLNGNFVRMNFRNDELDKVFMQGKALSVYYFIDDGKPNGLNKSSADSLQITVIEKKIDKIDLYGNPEGEFHPEELILNKEQEFQLGGFKWYKDKPLKEKLLEKRNLK